MIHLSFEKPNLEESNPNNAQSAKLRQDKIDEAKADFFKKGGIITDLAETNNAYKKPERIFKK